MILTYSVSQTALYPFLWVIIVFVWVCLWILAFFYRNISVICGPLLFACLCSIFLTLPILYGSSSHLSLVLASPCAFRHWWFPFFADRQYYLTFSIKPLCICFLAQQLSTIKFCVLVSVTSLSIWLFLTRFLNCPTFLLNNL